MDINKLIEEDNKKVEYEKSLKKAQRNLIAEFEEYSKLWKDLEEKLSINETYRNEVNDFFIDNGFVQSDTDYNGRVFMGGSTTHYKQQNTCITVSFSNRDLNEDIIQIIRPITGQHYNLVYKVNDDAMKKLEPKEEFKINNQLLFESNYKELIESCNSLEVLSNLDNQLKKHIQFLKENLNKDIENTGVYQLQDKRQFKTFKDAFNAL